MGLFLLSPTIRPQGERMVRNVTVKELDECLTQLNGILAKLASRIESLEEAVKAQPSPKPTTRKTAAKGDA